MPDRVPMSVELLDLGRYGTVLFDLDGTLYIDGRALPGAVEVVRACIDAGAAVGFLTNLSLWSKRYCIEALEAMGVETTPSRVVTAVDVLCHAIDHRSLGGLLAMLAPAHMAQRLQLMGYETIDLLGEPDFAGPGVTAVVVAQCESLDERAVETAARLVHHGAPLFSTSTNGRMPTHGSTVLAAGEVVQAIRRLVDVEPVDCGKPSPVFARAARTALGIDDPVLLVGDGLSTDIALANANGWTSLLVRPRDSGSSSQVLSPAPDFQVASLMELF